MLDVIQKATINDFLYSNEICYKAFFGNAWYSSQKLQTFTELIVAIDKTSLPDNYVSENYVGKYFESDDAKLMGVIREEIQSEYEGGELSEHEYNILLTSLLYSLDRCANTVGH